MNIRDVILLSTALIALAGCATQPPVPQVDMTTPRSIASEVRVTHDEFKKLTTYQGPPLQQDGLGALYIRAWKDDASNKSTYQIYVMDYYHGEWRFYNSAHDSNGQALNTTVISREVGRCSGRGGCSHFEHLGLNVSREYLEKSRETGLRFKISGKAGEQVYSIPAKYIDGFLLGAK